MKTMSPTDATDMEMSSLRPLPARFEERPRTVGAAIQMAVDAVENSALKPLSPDATSPVSQARAMLALLVNCYVHQTYSSQIAANLAARDPEFPWLWWEDFPDANTLRRFREENHDAVQGCLATALQLLAEQKISTGALTRIKAPQLAEEANRRMTMAAFADSMELNRK